MKPVIQRELDEIRRLIADLENRLKNEKVELGHREQVKFGRRGEAPAPTREDIGRVLTVTDDQYNVRWVTMTGTGGGVGGSATPDGHTLAQVTGVLNAEPLSGTINARFIVVTNSITTLSGSVDGHFNDLSGSVDGHFNALSGTINSAIVALSGTVDSGIKALSGTINARFVNLSGTIDGHFNQLSGTVNAAISGVLNLAIDEIIWAGGRTSYQSGIPLIVGSFRFDPSTTSGFVTVPWTGSMSFLASAANNLSTVKSFVQLWNVTDGYQVATASFSGTPFSYQSIGLSANGSGNLNIPNSSKDYEVRIFLSGTNGSTPNGASVELYSAGFKVSYRRSI